MKKLCYVQSLLFVLLFGSIQDSSNCSDCCNKYSRAILQLTNTFQQSSFKLEWLHYEKSFDSSKTSDIFDQWMRRTMDDSMTLNKSSEYNIALRLDTIFFTYENPSLSYPFNISSVDVSDILKKEDSVYYKPTNSYITSLEDVFKAKNCSNEYDQNNFPKLEQNLKGKNEYQGINLFISDIHSNENYNLISLGIIYSDSSRLNLIDPYNSGNILYVNLYMHKHKDETHVTYSHRIGLKPVAKDTILFN